jgi:5'-3' exonuclease
VDRKSKAIRNAAEVQKKFGVPPELIPDYLALVGDTADGYPGIEGIGPKGAASLLLRYGPIETFPDEALGKRRELALLFKQLATLKTDASLFKNVDELRWNGPTRAFAEWSERLGDKLIVRAAKAAANS